MTIRADAFRYGLLVGLKEAGLTEKVAYEILDGLEEVKYDLRGQEKTAKLMGAVKGLLGGAKGFAQGATGIGAKGIRKAVRGGAPAPAGFRSGAKVNRWLGKHPVAAGAVGAGGLMLGNRALFGANASQSDVDALKKTQDDTTAYLSDPNQRLMEMYQMAQLMRGGGGGGLPGWYNPRAIYG